MIPIPAPGSNPFQRDSTARRALALVLAALTALPPGAAWANPPVAAGTTNTQVAPAGNGVPVVNIAAPNASGLSHNQYNQFNVGPNGLVLNNATAIQQSVLAGTIRENPNLAGTAARVILNEVIAPNRSMLQGYQEVHGAAAQVILANPWGITCSGCGFINTTSGLLTTGVPNLDANGSLVGFTVRGGDIRIEGAGLDATGMSYFDLVARSIVVNGQINGADLLLAAGTNTYGFATRGIAPIGGDPNRPAYAIDTALLGGMYANRIRMIATEAGVGVRALGDVAATVGDVVLQSAGRIELANRMSAQRDVTVTYTGAAGGEGIRTGAAAGGVAAPYIHARHDTVLAAGAGSLALGTADVGAGNALALSGASLADTGAATNWRYAESVAGGALTLGLAGAATFGAASYDTGKGFALNAASAAFANANVYQRGDTSGLAITVAGTADLGTAVLQSLGRLDLTAERVTTGPARPDQAAALQSAGDMTVRFGSALDLNRRLDALGAMNLDRTGTGAATATLGNGGILQGRTVDIGSAAAAGGLAVTLGSGSIVSAENALTVRANTIAVNGSAGAGFDAAGQPVAGSSVTLDAATSISQGYGSELYSAGAMTLNAPTISTSAVMQSGGNLSLTADTLNLDVLYSGASPGARPAIEVGGNAAFAIGQSFTTARHVAVGGDLNLAYTGPSGSLVVAPWASLAAGGAVSVVPGTAALDIDVRAMQIGAETMKGSISASTTLALGARDVLLGGELIAGALTVDATRNLIMGANGLVYGQGDVALRGADVTLDGVLYGARDVLVEASQSFTDAGRSGAQRVADRDLTVRVLRDADLRLNGGQIYAAERTLTLSTQGALSVVGPPATGETLLVAGTGDLVLSAPRGITLGDRAVLYGGEGTVRLETPGRLALAAGHRVETPGAISAVAPGIDFFGRWIANGDVTLTPTDAAQNVVRINDGASIQSGDVIAIRRANGVRDLDVVVKAGTSGGLLRGDVHVHANSLLVEQPGTPGVQAGRLEAGFQTAGTDANAKTIIDVNALCTSAGGETCAANTPFTGALAFGPGQTDLRINGGFENQGLLTAQGQLSISTQGSFGNAANAAIGAGDGFVIRTTSIPGANAAMVNRGLLWSDGTSQILIGPNGVFTNDVGAEINSRHLSVLTSGSSNADNLTTRFVNHALVTGNPVNGSLLFWVGEFVNAHRDAPVKTMSYRFDAWERCGSPNSDCGFTPAGQKRYTGYYVRPFWLYSTDPLQACAANPAGGQCRDNAWLQGTQNVEHFPIFIRNPAPSLQDSYLYNYDLTKTNLLPAQPAYHIEGSKTVRQDWSQWWYAEEQFTGLAPTPRISANSVAIRTRNGLNDGGEISAYSLSLEGLNDRGLWGAGATGTFVNRALELSRFRYAERHIYEWDCKGTFDDCNREGNWLESQALGIQGHTPKRMTYIGRADYGPTHVYQTYGGLLQAVQFTSTIGNFQNTQRSADGAVRTITPPGATTPAGAAGSPAVDVAGRTAQPPSLGFIEPGSAALPLVLPTGPNGLFVFAQDPQAQYLIETNPLFTARDNPYLGSDYLMAKLGLDPTTQIKRLGDAMYENRLISDQIRAQTGLSLLRTAYTDADQQYMLLDNAVAEAKRLNLTFGTRLSAEQVAALKHDIVWMVESVVQGQRVLVPVVYLTDATRADRTVGPQIQAERAMIRADTFRNDGGNVNADVLQIVTRKDLVNEGGTIAGRIVALKSTEGDIVNRTRTFRAGDDRNFVTVAGRQGGILASEGLLLDAGRDIRIEGATVRSDGDATLRAGRDVNVTSLILDSRSTTRRVSGGTLGTEERNTTINDQSALTASVSAGGNLTLRGGSNVNLTGANLEAGGVAAVIAERGNVNVNALELNRSVSETVRRDGYFIETQVGAQGAGQGQGGARGGAGARIDAAVQGAPSADPNATRASVFTGFMTERSSTQSSETSNLGTTIRGGGVALISQGNDVNLQGARIEAGELGVALEAKRDINVVAAQDRASSSSNSERHQVGVSADVSAEGAFAGLTTRGGTSNVQRESSTANVTTITSGGNVTFNAGNRLVNQGTQVNAAGDIGIQARSVENRAAENTSTVTERSTYYDASIQAGVSTGGLGQSIAGVAQGTSRQINISAPETQVRIGGSGGESSGTTTRSQAVVTQLNAGGNIVARVTEGMRDEGTSYQAGRSVDIEAGRYEAAAAANRSSSTQQSTNASANLTVGLSTASEVNASLGAQGGSSNTSERRSEAVVGSVQAGENVRIRSRGDATLEGTRIQAGGNASVTAGGNLAINQANNTFERSVDSRQGGASITASVCTDLSCASAGAGGDGRVVQGTESATTGVAATIRSGGSTTVGAGSNLTLQGTRIQSGGDTNLSAGGRIDFQALSSTERNNLTVDGGSANVGGGVGRSMSFLKDGSANTSVTFERNRDAGSSETRVGGSIQSGGQLNITSGGETRLEGTQIGAQSARINVGALTMESAQSTEQRNQSGVRGGVSLTGGRNQGENGARDSQSFGGSVDVNATRDRRDNLTNQNARMNIAGGAELNVGGDATLRGANISAGGGITGNIGGNLVVESRTDRRDEDVGRTSVYAGVSQVTTGGGGGDRSQETRADRFDRRQDQAINAANHAGSTGLSVTVEGRRTDNVTIGQASGIQGASGLTVQGNATLIGAAPNTLSGVTVRGTTTTSEVQTRQSESVTSVDIKGTAARLLGSSEGKGGEISGNLVKGSTLFRDKPDAPSAPTTRPRSDRAETPRPSFNTGADDGPTRPRSDRPDLPRPNFGSTAVDVPSRPRSDRLETPRPSVNLAGTDGPVGRPRLDRPDTPRPTFDVADALPPVRQAPDRVPPPRPSTPVPELGTTPRVTPPAGVEPVRRVTPAPDPGGDFSGVRPRPGTDVGDALGPRADTSGGVVLPTPRVAPLANEATQVVQQRQGRVQPQPDAQPPGALPAAPAPQRRDSSVDSYITLPYAGDTAPSRRGSVAEGYVAPAYPGDALPSRRGSVAEGYVAPAYPGDTLPSRRGSLREQAGGYADIVYRDDGIPAPSRSRAGSEALPAAADTRPAQQPGGASGLASDLRALVRQFDSTTPAMGAGGNNAPGQDNATRPRRDSVTSLVDGAEELGMSLAERAEGRMAAERRPLREAMPETEAERPVAPAPRARESLAALDLGVAQRAATRPANEAPAAGGTRQRSASAAPELGRPRPAADPQAPAAVAAVPAAPVAPAPNAAAPDTQSRKLAALTAQPNIKVLQDADANGRPVLVNEQLGLKLRGLAPKYANEDLGTSQAHRDYDNWKDASGQPKGPVRYLDASERADREIAVVNGNFVWARTGEPFDTGTRREGAIFVMDANGRMYASTEDEPGRFHHSSFTGGEPVAMAGSIVVANGRPVHINSASGHYTPDGEQLTSMMRHLVRDKGLRLLDPKTEGASTIVVGITSVKDPATGAVSTAWANPRTDEPLNVAGDPLQDANDVAARLRQGQPPFAVQRLEQLKAQPHIRVLQDADATGRPVLFNEQLGLKLKGIGADYLDENLGTSAAHNLHGNWKDASGQPKGPVRYLNEGERADRELDVQGGLLVYRKTGQPFDTGERREGAIFVIDANGRIFASQEDEPGRFHHSSFTGGQPVALAGNLIVSNGRLLHVNNASGHYKPDGDQLVEGMRFLLNRKGLDVDAATIVGIGPVTNPATGVTQNGWVDPRNGAPLNIPDPLDEAVAQAREAKRLTLLQPWQPADADGRHEGVNGRGELIKTAAPQYLDEEARGVRYFRTDAEKDRVRLVVSGGRLYQKNDQGDYVLFSTGDRPQGAIFAIDETGNLYATTEHKVGEVHHSSLVEGRPVLGAGHIVVQDGVLLHINNNSGHYAPDERMFLQGWNLFEEAGVDMGRANWATYKPNAAGEMRWFYGNQELAPGVHPMLPDVQRAIDMMAPAAPGNAGAPAPGPTSRSPAPGAPRAANDALFTVPMAA